MDGKFIKAYHSQQLSIKFKADGILNHVEAMIYLEDRYRLCEKKLVDMLTKVYNEFNDEQKQYQSHIYDIDNNSDIAKVLEYGADVSELLYYRNEGKESNTKYFTLSFSKDGVTSVLPIYVNEGQLPFDVGLHLKEVLTWLLRHKAYSNEYMYIMDKYVIGSLPI